MMKNRLFACGLVSLEVCYLLLLYASLVPGLKVTNEAQRMEQERGPKSADQTFAFASYYQSNMVLQREPHQAFIWGYGTPGATVTITLNNQDVYSTGVKSGSDSRGTWSVKLDPQPAGKAADIQGMHDYQGELDSILLENLLFGDVWVCSGQSNMQFTMSMVDNSTEELGKTSDYPNIRIFTADRHSSYDPLFDLQSIAQSWSMPSPETVGGPDWEYFSAVCWLYGKYLYDTLRVPIGLVATSWAGTAIEPWSPPAALKNCGLESNPNDDLDLNKENPFEDIKDPLPGRNSVLWNAMVHPLLNMTIKGVIWYQGESNKIYHHDYYQCLFPSMIDNWRKEWSIGSDSSTDPIFPFGFVQLATVVATIGSFPIIRWHQTADYGYVPNDKMQKTFMAVAMDLPDNDSPYGSIHPRDKQDVARRLVNGALAVAYGQNVVYEGPFPLSITQNTEHDIIVRYTSYQNLVVSEKNNFQICCVPSCSFTDPEGSDLWHDTRILSYSEHTITLSSESCSNNWGTMKIRYAWALLPCKFKDCSVYNTEGLPAAPFIMDVKNN